MENAAGTKNFCRKCLLRDMGTQEEFFGNLRRYIDRIEPELKVEESVYEKRLAECRDCDMLLNGMCRICGCYVELRAVMKKNICPMVHPRWTRVPDEI